MVFYSQSKESFARLSLNFNDNGFCFHLIFFILLSLHLMKYVHLFVRSLTGSHLGVCAKQVNFDFYYSNSLWQQAMGRVVVQSTGSRTSLKFFNEFGGVFFFVFCCPSQLLIFCALKTAEIISHRIAFFVSASSSSPSAASF